MRPHPQKVARYCKETAKERSRRPREAVSVFMDGTGELSLMWALFGERCLRLLSAVKAGSVFFGRICTSVRTPLRAHLSLSNYLTA